MPTKRASKRTKSSRSSKSSKGTKKKTPSGRCPICYDTYNKTTRRPVRLHAATGRQPEHRACAACRAKIIARSARPVCPLCRAPIRVAPRTTPSSVSFDFPDIPDIPDIPEFAPPIARQAPPVRITPADGMPVLVRQPGFHLPSPRSPLSPLSPRSPRSPTPQPPPLARHMNPSGPRARNPSPRR